MVGRIATTRLVGFVLAVLAAGAHGQPLVPREPTLPLAATPLPFGPPAQPVPASLAQAQAAYAQALALEQAKHPESVDHYYAAISHSWLALTTSSTAAPPPPFDPQAWAIYHDSLARLILAGQRHGRLDPRKGPGARQMTGVIRQRVAKRRCRFISESRDSCPRAFVPEK